MKFHTTLAVLALLGTVACNGGDTDDTGLDDTDTGADTDTEDTNEPVDDAIGSIVLSHLPPNVTLDEELVVGGGLFLDANGGILNLAECVIFGMPCMGELPAAGSSAGVVTEFDFLDSVAMYQAGNEIEVGGNVLAYDADYGDYYGQGLTFGTGAAGIKLPGGDVAAYSGTEDFSFPDKMVATAPSPTDAIVLGDGDTIDFAWDTGSTGDVYLRVSGFGDTVVHGLEDDGEHTVSVADLTLGDAKAVFGVFVLGRATFSEVDAAGTPVHVQAISDQYFYATYLDGYTDITPSDTCGGEMGDPLAAGSWYGDLSGYTDDLDLGAENALTGYPTAGKDGVLPLSLDAGEKVTLTYTQGFGDGAIYLVTDCTDAGTATVAADDTLGGDAEVIEYTAGDSAESLYVVLDAYGVSGPFTLDVAFE